MQPFHHFYSSNVEKKKKKYALTWVVISWCNFSCCLPSARFSRKWRILSLICYFLCQDFAHWSSPKEHVREGHPTSERKEQYLNFIKLTLTHAYQLSSVTRACNLRGGFKVMGRWSCSKGWIRFGSYLARPFQARSCVKAS